MWEHETGDCEMVIVLLSGNFEVHSNHGTFSTINGRKDVFSGIAHTLYFPVNSSFSLRATSNLLDIAYGWCEADDFFQQSLSDLKKPQWFFLAETMLQDNSMI